MFFLLTALDDFDIFLKTLSFGLSVGQSCQLINQEKLITSYISSFCFILNTSNTLTLNT